MTMAKVMTMFLIILSLSVLGTVFAKSVNETVRHKSEEHPLDTCNASLGHCSRECQTKCCNQNCGIRYYGGKGYCVDIPRGGSLCQCHYPC
nr:hypothetical protein [Tanacetum cinerariifolium]